MTSARDWKQEHSLETCVLDTSVCIDLYNGGVLNLAFRLSHDLLLPDAIAHECVTPTLEELKNAGATLISLSAEHVALVETYSTKYRGPSIADLFALSYSKTEGRTLLTGDKKLREAATKEKVPVHGDLWILDELISEGLLTKADAIVALKNMRENGARLPADECQKRIRRWGK